MAKNIPVVKQEVGERLDKVVLSRYPGLNRSTIKKLIDNNKILVNNTVVKAGYALKTKDIINVSFSIDQITNIPKISLEILYEDQDCIVVNKPTGVLTHSKGKFNPEATVASFIAPKYKNVNKQNIRNGIVHRLDRGTSGVIIGSKNDHAQKWLQKQFANRKVKKTYVAVINSGLLPEAAEIDMPIARNTADKKLFRVDNVGKSAQTKYKITGNNGKYSEIELLPVTGRTHQIRVHLAELKHPIVGDDLYGGEPYIRLMLHAKSLEITLPSGERKKFYSELPIEFKSFVSGNINADK